MQVYSHIALDYGLDIVTKNQFYKLDMQCGHWVLLLDHSS